MGEDHSFHVPGCSPFLRGLEQRGVWQHLTDSHGVTLTGDEVCNNSQVKGNNSEPIPQPGLLIIF